MTRYLILGAGRFGRLAWQRLGEREPGAEICLVDHDPRKIRLDSGKSGTPDGDGGGGSFFGRFSEVERCRRIGLYRPSPGMLPLTGSGGSGQPGKSGAGYRCRWRWDRICRLSIGELRGSVSQPEHLRCPDDCPEPAEKCYLTGCRELNLYDYLENISLQDYSSLVIRSRQLAPGVGGYRPADLWQLRRQVLSLGGKILISTACRCHGVSHGLEKLTEREAVVDI